MNDFDFEELDKAVNALATKTHDEHGGPDPAVNSQAALDTTSQPVTSSSMPVSQSSVPESARPAQEPEPKRSLSPSPPARPQKHGARLGDVRPRRQGSFMDIVPPAGPRKMGARVGVSLQPVSKPEDVIPELPKEESQPQADRPRSAVQPESAPTPRPSEDAQPASQPDKPDEVSWPDPLDFNGSEVAKEDKQGQTDQPEPSSPFLAEAKVEKRPLGAFSNFRPAQEAEKSAPEPDHLLAETTDSADELTPKQDGIFKEPEKPKAPLADFKSDKKSEAPEAKSESEPSSPDLHSAAMMSIPQQYRTEKKETDTTSRPIFDTKEYHPPLLEAAVHEHRGGGSMWGKLFIALVVLVLLGVAGYFAFLYIIQR